MMASPKQHRELAAGYLFNEGFINRPDEILSVELAPNQSCVDVWLRGKTIVLPTSPIHTSGCGKGTTFADVQPLPPLDYELSISHRQLVDLMHQLQEKAHLYHQARGIHAAGLASPTQLIMVAEDIGRHNTLDKLAGRCLLEGIDPSGQILLTTGRISSEMISKARRMGLPLVASRSSPTSLSVRRAERWHITVVGYLRPERMQVYCHPERLQTENRIG